MTSEVDDQPWLFAVATTVLSTATMLALGVAVFGWRPLRAVVLGIVLGVTNAAVVLYGRGAGPDRTTTGGPLTRERGRRPTG